MKKLDVTNDEIINDRKLPDWFDFDYDEEEDTLHLYLNDSTLTIWGEVYKKLKELQKGCRYE